MSEITSEKCSDEDSTTIVARLISMQSENFKLLHQCGALDLEILQSKMKALEEENRALSLKLNEVKAAPNPATVKEVPKPTDHSSKVFQRIPSFSSTNTSTTDAGAEATDWNPLSDLPPPAVTSSAAKPKKSRTTSLPHGFRPPIGLMTSGAPQLHPLARANNYNAGSNEVFQPFMFKQKRKSVNLSAGVLASAPVSGSSTPITTASSGDVEGGGGRDRDRWTKGLALDIRDEQNVHLIRSLASGLASKHQSINLSAMHGSSVSMGSDVYRDELSKILGTGGFPAWQQHHLSAAETGDDWGRESDLLSVSEVSVDASFATAAKLPIDFSEAVDPAILEFCSVEADYNQLLSQQQFLGPEGSVIYPSRLPSVVTSTYPESSVSSIDSVNSFCFPGGVTVETHSKHAAHVLTGPQHDQFHILQFTNQYGETSYACCLIVSMASPLSPHDEVSTALVEMTLQKVAAQRIKKAMRQYIVALKKQRWQSINTQSSSRTLFATRSNSTSKLVPTDSTRSIASNQATSITASQPSMPPKGKGRKSLSGDDEVKEKSSSFIYKYFGSSSTHSRESESADLSAHESPTAAPVSELVHSDDADNHNSSPQTHSGAALTTLLQPEAQDSSRSLPSQSKRPSSYSSTTTSTSSSLSSLDVGTRAKLENIALAIKKAKDASISLESSPAMQMSEEFLHRNGFRFCDDESVNYLEPLEPSPVDATRSRRSSTSSVTSTSTSTLTTDGASESGEKKKYKLSSFFGFSGRKSRDKGRSYSQDSIMTPAGLTSLQDSARSLGVAETVFSDGDACEATTNIKAGIASRQSRPTRRPLRERFTDATQYLVFQKAYCIITISPQLSLMFKILLAMADAERHSDSSPTTSNRPPRSPLQGASVNPDEGTMSAQQLHKWQIKIRQNFLSQVHRALVKREVDVDRGAAAAEHHLATRKHETTKKGRSPYCHPALASPRSSLRTVCTPGYIDEFVVNEEVLPTTQEWTTAVLLSCISQRNIVQLVNLLLMEKSLVIVGKNVGMVTALAFAVTNLLSPFTWEGVFVPMVPDSARELFGAPVPFILGTTSPPRGEDLSPTAAVLFLQETLTSTARAGSRQKCSQPMVEYSTWFTRLPEVSADMPLPDYLERETAAATTLFSSTAAHMWERNEGQNATVDLPQAPASRSHPDPAANNLSLFATASSWKAPNLNLNISFLTQMSVKEKRTVHNFLQALHQHNRRFAGDLSDPSAWRRYIKFNSITEEDEFIPHLFMEPLRSVVEFQDAVVQTQLFLGYVDRVRTDYNLLEPYRVFIRDWLKFQWPRRHRGKGV